MKAVAWTVGILGAVLLVREAYVALIPQRQRRRSLYEAAVQRARDTGKSLIVVGSPASGVVTRFFGADYGCGSVCVDVVGCPMCETYIRGRIEDVLPQFAAGSAVIFASDVLEYVDDPAAVAAQMDRVSGGDVFIATVDPTSLTAWFWPGARRRVIEAPPFGTEVVYKTLPWNPEPSGASAHIIDMPNYAARGVAAIPAYGEEIP